MKQHAALLIAALAVLPAAAGAQTAESPSLVPPPTFSRTATVDDAAFVYRMLLQADRRLALADIAQRNAQRQSTRDLAARETAKWTAMRDRLMDIASVQGFRTPTAADVSGQGFDQWHGDDAYVALVERSNARAMQAMQAERRSSNPALVAFVNDHLRGI